MINVKANINILEIGDFVDERVEGVSMLIIEKKKYVEIITNDFVSVISTIFLT